jgi:hypothetical protein
MITKAAEKYHNKISKKRNTQLGVPSEDFIAGAKWQAERMYSEEEVIKLLEKAHFVEENIYEWFEKHKKK